MQIILSTIMLTRFSETISNPMHYNTGIYHTCAAVRLNPFLPTVAFNICCPRDCVSRHNGGTAGAPLKPLRDDSAREMP